MAPKRWPNLAAMFFDRAAAGGDDPFLWSKHDGEYRPQSWREVAHEVSALSRGLRAAGVVPGDRVALVSENRPNWVVADLAIISAGAITVPGYTTNTVDDHKHIFGHSGARALIISGPAMAERSLPAARHTPGLDLVVSMDTVDGSDAMGMTVTHWDDMVASGEAENDDVARLVDGIAKGDLACLIYTSGTGGRPKGVMLSHAAIAANLWGAHGLLKELGLDNEIFLSFLPLSHSYEHTAGLFFPISLGAQIYYAERVDTLTTNLLEARPTFMTCVPRLYETMRARILGGVQRTGGLKQKLFETAVSLGTKRYHGPHSLGFGERLLDGLVERLVREKVRGRFGGRLKALVSGGAPLNEDVGLFFLALGLPVLQGYGQTESAPVISVNRPEMNDVSTVGPPLDGVEVKVAGDGEILVRGELVMDGYWNAPEATAAALVDGWLHTGDIGEIDDRGRIRITDRKKDIIVNSGGDNLSPQRVEGVLMLEPEIAQTIVYGDRRPYLVALIVPDDETTKAHANDPEALTKTIAQAVARASAGLATMENVKRFALAAEPFTIDNGEMTPTMKTRRHAIIARYGEVLEGLY
ncbi:MAG: AMP-dependent synthetase/ligase [Pseudomonadota bacterium]|nr:AMP-dependent synthetase/ligase [Pseudomonadota bacterium]